MLKIYIKLWLAKIKCKLCSTRYIFKETSINTKYRWISQTASIFCCILFSFAFCKQEFRYVTGNIMKFWCQFKRMEYVGNYFTCILLGRNCYSAFWFKNSKQYILPMKYRALLNHIRNSPVLPRNDRSWKSTLFLPSHQLTMNLLNNQWHTNYHTQMRQILA